jgi:hypothetical protein
MCVTKWWVELSPGPYVAGMGATLKDAVANAVNRAFLACLAHFSSEQGHALRTVRQLRVAVSSRLAGG